MGKVTEERWLPIEGWPPYEVSNFGRVRNKYPRYGIPVALKPVLLNSGYTKVTLCYNRSRKDLLIHRLVAIAFLGPCPPKHEVNHKDFDKTNNREDNLEWVTRSGNALHAVLGGHKFIPPIHAPASMARGERHGRHKLSLKQVHEIRVLLSAGSGGPYLAQHFGVGLSTIYRIKYNTTWKGQSYGKTI